MGVPSKQREKGGSGRCNVLAKALQLFDGFLSLLRTAHEDPMAGKIEAADRSDDDDTAWIFFDSSRTFLLSV